MIGKSLSSAVAVVLLIAASGGAAKAFCADAKSKQARIDHGQYLVMIGGCNHCHSPKVMSPQGPVPHPMKILSGYDADQKVPALQGGVLGPDKWMALTNSDLTAWAGPWGISFAANLTPDAATGIGGWTEEIFIKTLRTGKHMGTGRPILPPMPWSDIGRMTDDDLKDVFAYLMSLKPVKNLVPQPAPPAGK